MSSDDQDDLPPEAVASAVDAGPGTGAYSASEDWVRANHRPVEHDGRAHTRTYFNARDAPGHFPDWQRDRDPDDRRSWAKIAQWQDGAQSDRSRGAQNWWADKQRWVDTFGETIGATEYHRDEAKRVLAELSLEPGDDDETSRMTTYQSARVPIEGVIMGILSLLVDADINNFESRTLKRDGVRDLLEDLEMDVSEYEHIRSLLRQNDADVLFPRRA